MLAVWVHEVPSQCRTIPSLLVKSVPAAQILVAETAVTLISSSSWARPPGLGLFTRVHEVPFQCRMKVWPVCGVVSPTAQALLAEVTATESRELPLPDGLGVGVLVQA